jgi:hypothetical protein
MMQFNWGEKDRLIYMDLETQSALNIKKEGAKQYLESATTRLLSAVFLTGDELLVWAPKSRLPRGYDYSAEDASGYGVSIDTGEDCPESIRQRISDGYTFVAHNAETFDAIAWARFCPDVSANWIDTLHLCRLYGYPGSLDGASKAMGGSGKSDATAMKLLTTARIVGSNLVYPVGTAPLWDALIAYNIKDVLELKRIAGEVLFRDRYREDAILHRSTEINQRGVKIDVEYVRKLRDVWQLMQNESYDEISRLTGGKLDATNIRSPKQVKGYLESLGFSMTRRSTLMNVVMAQRMMPVELLLSSLNDRTLRATLSASLPKCLMYSMGMVAFATSSSITALVRAASVAATCNPITSRVASLMVPRLLHLSITLKAVALLLLHSIWSKDLQLGQNTLTSKARILHLLTCYLVLREASSRRVRASVLYQLTMPQSKLEELHGLQDASERSIHSPIQRGIFIVTWHPRYTGETLRSVIRLSASSGRASY